VNKRPNSEPHGATRQQAIMKALDSWCNYRICSSGFQGLVRKSHSQKPQEALNLLVREERY
jgi:hypothetical protein